jgi:hypothetical protein
MLPTNRRIKLDFDPCFQASSRHFGHRNQAWLTLVPGSLNKQAILAVAPPTRLQVS